MSEPSLVSQGLELMIFGMGVVFVFLTMLVFVTGFMSKLVNKLAPEQEVVAAPVRAAKPQGCGPAIAESTVSSGKRASRAPKVASDIITTQTFTTLMEEKAITHVRF